MPVYVRLEITFTIATLVMTCHNTLDKTFPRLPMQSRKYVRIQKKYTCEGNPCESSKPFLCRSSPSCIRLNDICDGKWDCPDGFDEEPGVCYGASRPPLEAIYKFLIQEQKWIIPKLFNNADPEMVAHELSLSTNTENLERNLKLKPENTENIRKAFEGTIEGDERPLLNLGMPERSWPEVKFLFESLIKSGFNV